MAFSAFPNMPGDTGSTIGRADQASLANNTVEVKDLFEMLRKYSKASPVFNREMRKVAYEIAKKLAGEVRVEAGTVSRSSQAIQVAKGLRASNDRIPTIKLRSGEAFISKSRPNRTRRKPVTRGDVFFGAEFGGGATKTTQQFLRHRGQSGYFFWPTVRKRKNEIAKDYLDGLQKVIDDLSL